MKNIALLVSVFVSQVVYSQKYDYWWVLSDAGGNIDMIFTDSGANAISHHRNVYMDNSQTTISDTAGNLLFYTNGAKIYNIRDSVMLNGDSINYGPEWEVEGGLDYNTLDEIIGLPTDTMGVWNLIHYYDEYTPLVPPFSYPWRIEQSRVDMRMDTELGAVVFKNKILIQDTVAGYMTACQHANGRDWWVLESKSSSNCLYTLLVQPDTVIQYPQQCLGSNYISGDAGQAAFSPDGTKFAWVGGYGGVNIYDFDRCSGQLSDPVNLPFFYSQDSGILQYGLAFSPNSRYIYIAQSIYIIQFDTYASNIISSADTIGYYTSPPDSNSFPGYYFLMQLAADGKIYISASNSISWLHVINEPDKKGDSCNFVNYGFPLPNENSFGLPSYPGNYRLGALKGSPCDTIPTATQIIADNKEKILKVFPNPALDYAIIDYGFTNWSNGQPNLEICNALGQVVYAKILPMYSGFQKIDVSGFAAGIYTIYIKRNGGVVAASKLVKQ